MRNVTHVGVRGNWCIMFPTGPSRQYLKPYAIKTLFSRYRASVLFFNCILLY